MSIAITMVSTWLHSQQAAPRAGAVEHLKVHGKSLARILSFELKPPTGASH